MSEKADKNEKNKKAIQSRDEYSKRPGYRPGDYEAYVKEETSVAKRNGETVEYELDPKYKGEKTYVVNAPHYRLGRTYQPGEKITVTDEAPSKTWTPYEEDEREERKGKHQHQAPATSTGMGPAKRPSDKDF